ncbi:hypothetical protein ACI8CA_004598 [Salmonella enterica]|uniref:hypothetical protein n=1 Tax=Salmonella enterica TaxID=28901 RepID=UPI000FBB25DC|nr:hypothetical protein [Salmonella enterica]EBH8664252.1 hypothetical protein [Salmonella enterica subsp. enterica serovar Luke]ECY6147778.1 hypothetical protein [Salmonella enterica subsp. enterica serovar Bron]EDH3766039.1 hypothetical protein [Salmonella enterica subsp. enterica]EHG9651871.1 hypothetical protein [Salmonella enterica subsp. enterica serovar Monschaui]MLT90658.1 hypothetical protein [Salmonella enterica subsp. enterica serovar Muenchen]HBL9995365.1 hypothetical protein [Sal
MKNKNSEYLEKIRPQLECVTVAQFSAYLNAVGASKKCLSCGSHELVALTTHRLPETLSQDDQHLEAKEIFEKYTFMQIHYGYSELDIIVGSDIFFRTTCNNCGFTMSYVAPKVTHWIQKEKESHTDE